MVVVVVDIVIVKIAAKKRCTNYDHMHASALSNSTAFLHGDEIGMRNNLEMGWGRRLSSFFRSLSCRVASWASFARPTLVSWSRYDWAQAPRNGKTSVGPYNKKNYETGFVMNIGKRK